MISISLYPTIDYCIESAARKVYLELQRQILDTNPTRKELATRLMILEEFLSNADFKKLRAESEDLLLNGERVEYIIWREKGKVSWKMQATS